MEENNEARPIAKKRGGIGKWILSALIAILVVICLATCMKTVPTGVRVAIPKGYVGLLFARSSLCKYGMLMANGAGVIDSGYTGEIQVPLLNAGDSVFRVWAGERIAQLVILPCELPTFTLVDELEDTERGEGGFGSTGVE